MRWLCHFAAMSVLVGCGGPTEIPAPSLQPQSAPPTSTLPAQPAVALEPAAPPRITGKVIKVADGDTLTLLDASETSVKIRFNGIDAPETAQAFGDKAKQALAERVAGKIVTVETHGQDKYSRTIGDVILDGESVNLWLVESGWAWHFKEYSDDEQLAAAEVTAREQGVGLWAGPGPIAPWDWRHPPFDPNDERFYVQGKGKRYHRASCRALDSRRRVISIEEARETKKTPCRLCKPPDLLETGGDTQ